MAGRTKQTPAKSTSVKRKRRDASDDGSNKDDATVALRFIGRVALRLHTGSQGVGKSLTWEDVLVHEALHHAVSALPEGLLKSTLSADLHRYGSALVDRLQALGVTVTRGPPGDKEGESAALLRDKDGKGEIAALPILEEAGAWDVLTDKGYLQAATVVVKNLTGSARQGKTGGHEDCKLALQRLLLARTPPPPALVASLLVVQQGMAVSEEVDAADPEHHDLALLGRDAQTLVAALPAVAALSTPAHRSNAGACLLSLAPVVAAALQVTSRLRRHSLRGPDAATGPQGSVHSEARADRKLLRRGAKASEQLAGRLLSILLDRWHGPRFTALERAGLACEPPLQAAILPWPVGLHSADWGDTGGLATVDAFELPSKDGGSLPLKDGGALLSKDGGAMPSKYGFALLSRSGEAGRGPWWVSPGGILAMAAILRVATTALRLRRSSGRRLGDGVEVLPALEVAAFESCFRLGPEAEDALMDLLLGPTLSLDDGPEPQEEALVQACLCGAVVRKHRPRLGAAGVAGHGEGDGSLAGERTLGGEGAAARLVVVTWLKRAAVGRQGEMLWRRLGERARGAALLSASLSGAVPGQVSAWLTVLRSQGGNLLPSDIPWGLLPDPRGLAGWLVRTASEETFNRLLELSRSDPEGLLASLPHVVPAPRRVTEVAATAGDSDSEAEEDDESLFFVDKEGARGGEAEPSNQAGADADRAFWRTASERIRDGSHGVRGGGKTGRTNRGGRVNSESEEEEVSSLNDGDEGGTSDWLRRLDEIDAEEEPGEVEQAGTPWAAVRGGAAAEKNGAATAGGKGERVGEDLPGRGGENVEDRTRDAGEKEGDKGVGKAKDGRGTSGLVEESSRKKKGQKRSGDEGTLSKKLKKRTKGD